ncbi:hypothetical protein VTJ04DRAFT_4097 [Mycothermus thermophilus]|uniref:uncharacterized protein n=1 Tax=Humicola insolens TaxID=85995 RepID=UPI0037425596
MLGTFVAWVGFGCCCVAVWFWIPLLPFPFSPSFPPSSWVSFSLRWIKSSPVLSATTNSSVFFSLPKNKTKIDRKTATQVDYSPLLLFHVPTGEEEKRAFLLQERLQGKGEGGAEEQGRRGQDVCVCFRSREEEMLDDNGDEQRR